MNFSVKPVLTGEKTVLRPFTADDAEAILEILDDPDVIRFTFPSQPDTPFTLERLRAVYGARATQPDRLDLAVTDPATGELVGEVVLNEWDPVQRSCSFRTLIGPRGRDRGFGTEAVRLIVGHGFEQLGLHRISLGVYGNNHRARRVYEKVGFVVEGVLREAALRDGEWVDEVLMAILDHEWAAHGGHPEGRVSSTAR
ncbi:GNAT family N-acetyltransferase [Streptomyces sp. Tue6028]|uniref:GNAT family N-acetyltransferase n=1 Tax=Streptomyces sp. Tue6028 TaxID=2036037 RepID=UPI000BB3A110|nr:GNAT family protein [Streptomyces sp. Tue6028]PBC63685.1 GNAT family N-acetyltransferase [Streptomyces sp. Tue6028]